MLNLAFIGSEAEAERYGSIMNRIDGARLFAFVPMDKDHTSGRKYLPGDAIKEDSIENLLRHHRNELDAIVIHTQSERIQDLVKVATHAGLPTLAGPLLARNSQGLNALAAELEAGLLAPAFAWRFLPAIQSVKASIDAGKLGEIGLIRMHRWNSPTTTENNGIPDRIIPEIDIATWFFNAQPKKIFSLKSPSVNNYIQMHLHFNNGGMAVIDDTEALPEGGDYFSLSVIGAKGAAYADDHRNMNLVVDGIYPQAIRTGQDSLHIARQLQEFVDMIRGEQPSPLSQQDVLKVLQVSDAVLEAIAGNKVLVWEDGKYA